MINFLRRFVKFVTNFDRFQFSVFLILGTYSGLAVGLAAATRWGILGGLIGMVVGIVFALLIVCILTMEV